MTGQHVARFLHPGPPRPRAWCQYYTLFLPLPTGHPGIGVCQASLYLSPFQRPTSPKSSSDESFEMRLYLGSRGEGKEALGPLRDKKLGKRKREEQPQPASEPVIAEQLLFALPPCLGLPPLTCLLGIGSSQLRLWSCPSWKTGSHSMPCVGWSRGPWARPSRGHRAHPEAESPGGAGAGFLGILHP